MTSVFRERDEWLEADGRGGFASGTAGLVRTRRYHALLLSATTPPAGRMVLVNGFDAWVETAAGRFALTAQRYAPDAVFPDGHRWIGSFDPEPWPRWTFDLPDGTRVVHELFVRHGNGEVHLSWRREAGDGPARLEVRPFLSGRDYHGTHRENGTFAFEPETRGAALLWRPYPGVPAVVSRSNGTYRHAPDWYRQFLYAADAERGLDAVEDLASPGVLSWDLDREPAIWTIGTAAAELTASDGGAVTRLFEEAREVERRRRAAFASPIDRAADAYLVRRGTGWTVVAGYPWFTDWGRDTFIAMRGLCLATGRLAEARDILVEWSGAVSEGMLPNRFPDTGDQPEYNSVDASLWFVVVADELIRMADLGRTPLAPADRARLVGVIEQILSGYARGTRHGIRMADDGLLAAGEPGWQLTWMDAKVGDRVITPRVGKPVEIEALWLNALAIGSARNADWRGIFDRAREAFVRRFWNEERGHLNDVVDVDHVPGAIDPTCRPNQILAVGGLPMKLLDTRRAGRVVDAVESRLLTPYGLRSLAPGEPDYSPRYEGGPAERDAVYHQGAVWPWLMGPFIEAWARVRGATPAARRRARERFLAPLAAHLQTAGLGHVSELLDAEQPFTPRGCPFQAWSLGELIRVDRTVLGPGTGRAIAEDAAQPAPWLGAAMRVHTRLVPGTV